MFTTKHVPYHVCGAQQDNSTACVGSQANPGAGEGSLPPIFYAVGGGESGYIAPDPNDLNVFYAGSYGGFLSRAGSRDRPAARGQHLPEQPDGLLGDRHQGTLPVDVPDRLLAGGSARRCMPRRSTLWRTTNGGQSWEKISPNLTRSDPKTLQASGGPITKDQTGVETYGVIFTIAPSRQDVNTIWTGSDDGWVHVTRDGGKNWEKVTPPDLPEFTRISLIEASPHQNGAAYLAGESLSARRSRAVHLQDHRLRQDLDEDRLGIPDTDFPRAIREDPKRAGLLYVGTEHGIYVSFNDGAPGSR